MADAKKDSCDVYGRPIDPVSSVAPSTPKKDKTAFQVDKLHPNGKLPAYKPHGKHSEIECGLDMKLLKQKPPKKKKP